MSHRFDASQAPRVLGPNDGKLIDLKACGVRFMVFAEESGSGFSLVEHPIPPRHLAAPLHRHSREDEYSYVLEGEVGAWLGGRTVFAKPGDFIVKPRDQWHTFWNAGDGACRILEIISPGGFEHYFEDVVERPSPDIAARYGIETDFQATDQIRQRFTLVFPVPRQPQP